MTDEKPMAKLQIGVEAYKAKNAQNGWTGRGYGLEPFFLNLNKDGGASVGFAEKDANYERDDETGREYIYCNSPVEEVIALRDFLNEAFPVDPAIDREKLAAWMIRNSLATGHGDTVDDLLHELQVHVDEFRETIKELRTYARV